MILSLIKYRLVHYYFMFYSQAPTSQTTLTMVSMKKAGTTIVRNRLGSVQLITHILEPL